MKINGYISKWKFINIKVCTQKCEWVGLIGRHKLEMYFQNFFLGGEEGRTVKDTSLKSSALL